MNTIYRLISTAITLTGILTLSAQQVGGSSISVRTYTSTDTTRYVEEKAFDNGLSRTMTTMTTGARARSGCQRPSCPAAAMSRGTPWLRQP